MESPNPMTPTSATPTDPGPSVCPGALTPRERSRIRLLAQRYRMRRDIALRPAGRKAGR